MKLRLKVIPGASQESHEWMDAQKSLLKVRVTAAPEKGKANKAVEKYLARQIRHPASTVTITSGSTSQQKTVDFGNLDEKEIRSRLDAD